MYWFDLASCLLQCEPFVVHEGKRFFNVTSQAERSFL